MSINKSQLKALLYKEYLTYKKSFISVLLVQIIIPLTLGYLLLVYVPLRVEKAVRREEKLNSSKLFKEKYYVNSICDRISTVHTSELFAGIHVYVYPPTRDIEKFMENVKKKCPVLNPIAVFSEADLDKNLTAMAADRLKLFRITELAFGAVIFRNLSKHYLNYELRPVYYDDVSLYQKQYSRYIYMGINPYVNSFFVDIQRIINEAFLEMVKPSVEQANNETEKRENEAFEIYSVSQMRDINMFTNMPVMAPIFLYFAALVSTILPLMAFLKRILDEKKSQMRKLLKLMAMKELEYWLTKCFFVVLIFIFLDAYIVFLVRLQTEDRVDVSLTFVVLLIYFMSSMFLAMALSTICDVAIFGIAAFLGIGFLSSVTLWFFLKSPGETHWMMFQGKTSLPEELYILMCVIVPPNFSLICSLILIMEGHSFAYSSKYVSSYVSFSPRWWNIFKVTPPYRVLSFGIVLVASIASMFLWLFYFLMLVKLLGADGDISPKFDVIHWSQSKEVEISLKKDKKYFESEPKQLKVGIVINSLTKRISGKEIIKNLSLNLYYGQITVLLGHNGAGKSTLINMITGITEPSSGNIFVNGFDVIRDKQMMQGKVGLCPQKEILFENFTVEEHLYIFAILKGHPSNDIANEITRVLELLNLTEKRKVRAMSLSIGMRRKLQFGVSIVGGCNILILDEPSSGLDVESRRLIWDLLRSLRKTFLIFMTTHHMEEADCLADRVIVMADGRIICSGSTPYLKSVFNVGHHLRILRREGDKSLITKFVLEHCSEAKLENEALNETVFRIPPLNTEKLKAFCQKLEAESSNIGVQSFGLTATPLDDVFLTTYELFKKERKPSIINFLQNNVFRKSRKISDKRMTCALFLKRLQTDLRRWKTLVAAMTMNILATLVLFCMMNSYIEESVKLSSKKFLQMNYTELKYNNVIGFCSANNSYFCDTLSKTAKDFGIQLNQIDNTPDEYAIDMISKDYEFYREKVVLGIERNGSRVNVWHLNQAPHSLPIGFNILYNYLLTQLTNNSDAKIQTSLHSIPTPGKTTIRRRLQFLDRTLNLTAYFLVYTLLLAACSSSILLTNERFTKAKLLQYLSGATPLAYWATNIIYDCLFLFVIAIPFWLFAFFFSKNIVFFNTITFLGVFVSFIGFMLSNASFNFLMSQIFTKPSTAFAVLFLFNAISSTVILEVSVFSKRGEDVTVHFLITVLLALFEWITSISYFRLFVEVVLGSMKATLSIHLCSWMHAYDKVYIGIDRRLKDCNPKCKKCYDEHYNPFWGGDPGVLFEIIWIYVLFFGSALLSFVIEMRLLKHDLWNESKPALVSDYDVKAENELVAQLIDDQNKEESEWLFLCHQLTKTFVGLPNIKQLSQFRIMAQFTSVSKLSFTVKRNEFFGLLGVNGAGKSTTFRMLTGDLIPSSGSAYLSSYSLLDDFQKYQQEIGYCPQNNVLFDHLTGRQTLKIFARIRGISEEHLNETVDDLLKFVDLEQYSDTTTTVYSGGNMRKLSLGVSLIGCPSILFLDEPTSGVDPFGRRQLWKAITNYKVVNSGSVILSSHSLDECEALCNRIAILARGTLQCIGSIQHLKSKYCQGYSVSIKANREKNNLEHLDTVFKETFPNSKVIDEHYPCIIYLVQIAEMSVSRIFELMEEIKQRLDLEHYQVSQMTLEHLFLKFSIEASETKI